MLPVSQIVYLLVAVVAGLASKEYIVGFMNRRQESSYQNKQEAIPVKMLTVENSPMVKNLKFNGVLQTRNFIKIKPERPGRITYINKSTLIKSGEILVQFDDSVESANLIRAEGGLKKAQDPLKRAQERAKSGQVASSEMNTYESDFSIAKGDRDRALAEVQTRKIIAQFNGKLGIPQFSEGAVVAAGEIIATFRSTDDFIVDFVIPESAVKEIYPGKSVKIMSGLVDQFLTGTIEAVDPSADATYCIKVRAKMTSPNIPDYCAGSSVTVIAESDQRNVVSNIDERAIDDRSGSFYIYVCRKDSNGKWFAYRTVIEVLNRSNGRVQVNLAPGTMYCIPPRKGMILDQREVIDLSPTLEKQAPQEDDDTDEEISENKDVSQEKTEKAKSNKSVDLDEVVEESV